MKYPRKRVSKYWVKEEVDCEILVPYFPLSFKERGLGGEVLLLLKDSSLFIGDLEFR